METRQLHVRDLSTVTGIQQYEHCVQSIFFLGLEDFEGTIYLSIESDEFNEDIALTNNTFIIGQPMTKFNTTYTCQIYGIVGTGTKIQLSKQFRMMIDKSNNISGEAGEYPIDPNLVNGIDQYITQKEADIDAYVDDAIESIPSDYTELESRVDELEDSQGSGLSNEAKQALLACFAKVAWIDEDGQDYYDALESALYAITELSVSPTSLSFGTLGATQQLTGTTTPTGGTITWTSSNTSVATVDSTGLVTSVGYGTATITASCQGYTATCAVTIAQATVTSISAVYTQSGTVYDTDSLDDLKSDLVVTAHYDNGTSEVVTNYTLSGTLTEGTSVITVNYGGKTTAFTVNVTHVRQVSYESGYIDDSGNLVAKSGAYVSNEYDKVTAGSFVQVQNCTSATIIRINEYDSNKNFIQRSYASDVSSGHAFLLSQTTAYLRIGFETSDPDTTFSDYVLATEGENLVYYIGQSADATSGELIADDKKAVTDFIPAGKNEIGLFINSSTGLYYTARCYDSNKAILGSVSPSNLKVGTSNDAVGAYRTVVANTAYVRLVFALNSSATIQMTHVFDNCLLAFASHSGSEYNAKLFKLVSA